MVIFLHKPYGLWHCRNRSAAESAEAHRGDSVWFGSALFSSGAQLAQNQITYLPDSIGIKDAERLDVSENQSKSCPQPSVKYSRFNSWDAKSVSKLCDGVVFLGQLRVLRLNENQLTRLKLPSDRYLP